MSSKLVHPREQDQSHQDHSPKRIKLADQPQQDHILPPSHALLGIPLPVAPKDGPIKFMEHDVGISEYISRDVPQIEGVIKQRFTDFLVYEVDLDGRVIHLNDIGKPKISDASQQDNSSNDSAPADEQDVPSNAVEDPWPESFTMTLSAFLSPEKIAELKDMYFHGPMIASISQEGTSESAAAPPPEAKGSRRHRKREKKECVQEDHRQVLSDPITSKDTRTALHKAIRQLFKGKLDSQIDTSIEDGSRVAIRWARKEGERGGRGVGDSRGSYPPYIHLTLQKTNRDTQDALGHLARSLHISVKDLSVAGTKDKRGVTVQRVSIKRGNKTVDDVWKVVNGINPRRPAQVALQQRGERGIRIADLNYHRASLELGMLKGNSFIITLRNVRIHSMSGLEEAMNSVKTRGFINYYGMQRFGTASVPTHSIGLALLKSEWQKAVTLILSKRQGEHPDVDAARDAWLRDGDLDKALELMPRRVVAERCILESFKKQKGDTRNAMGALSTIPRNLRLMYVHAYQSYIWNAIVSERIRVYGAKPIVGDLVFEEDSWDQGSNSRKVARKPWTPPRVKTLAYEDLDKYNMFDVIMPLPGTDVAYPGGELGKKYREFLHMDALDPDNWVRKQREYTLNGSYRAVLHQPKDMSWSVLRYTDPDVALAQADEDKLLGFDPPITDANGKFLALQINITLGTAAYATMALREITKTDTSSHYQTGLTQAAEDQKYRGYEKLMEDE
ncbi:hypothetical protein AMATHDRAFT_73940 [Amanita thiersii Skay4041]|uniref:TRUD domain-containing protein n=1 Tax=Amanita thiersii Skay4041 TaxID=703135 RepID=A0A2A9NTY0_9AGAR|nr:hypothetical protein AMATHDRAFT_73940 [Amanita thiersii Skay4041]